MNRFAFKSTGARRFAGVLLLAGLVLAGIPAVSAQSITGSIKGTVLDPNGSAMSGVGVEVRNLDAGWIRQMKTDVSGAYRTASLPLGRYAVAAVLPTSEKIELGPIEVAPGAETTVAAASSAAQVQATITMETETPLVDATKSQLSKNFDTLAILELPGRRSSTDLALLKPGVVPNNTGPGSAFSVNGNRPDSNHFHIDGGYNNDPVQQTPRQNLPPEAMQEFQMFTAGHQAEYGRHPGGWVDQLARTGTNGLHGTLMYTWNGNSFDALSSNQKRTFEGLRASGLSDGESFRRARAVIVDNKALVSGGGPLWRDRVFFFSSWDRDWFRTTAQPDPILAISPRGIENLRAVRSELAPGALDFLTRTFPTANDATFRGDLSFVTPRGAMVSVPLEQFNLAQAGGVPYGRDFWRFLQKFDFKVMESNSLNLRWLVDDLRDPGAPAAILGTEIGQDYRNHSAALNDIHVFSPNQVNEFRFTYGRIANRFRERLPMTVNVTGFNTLGNPNFPQSRKDNAFEWVDNFIWTTSHHTFKFGFFALRYHLNSSYSPNLSGTLGAGSLADLLLGRDLVFSQFAGDDFVRGRTTEIGNFFQDDWKISRNFSLNFGLRWEVSSVPFGFFSDVRRDADNVAPRFGFAWSPDAGGRLFEKTVFRGGYAMMYDQVYQRLLLHTARNFPRGVTIVSGPTANGSFFDPATRPFAPMPSAFSGNTSLLPRTLVGGDVDDDGDREMEIPYNQNFHLGMERELARGFVLKAYYVGSRGLHLYRMVDRNTGFTAAAVAANPSFFDPLGLQPVMQNGRTVAFRQDASRGPVTSLEPIGQSWYHSGQFTLQKRYSAGIRFEGHYTWSSYISDSDDFLTPASNPFDLRADRSRSNYDQPHRFAANYIFAVPFFADRGVLTRVLGGWEIAGATTAASGMPFSVMSGPNVFGILPGQNPNIFGVQRTTSSPTFSGANSGMLGTVGRNTNRMPWIHTTDLAFVKSLKTFAEHQSLQLRGEVFNVFNRRNFTALPYNVVDANTDTFRFLNYGQTNSAGRAFMFTARYFF